MTHNDITLDGSTATWVMPLTDGELQGSYRGTFKFRTFLDPIQQLQAGREFREFLGPYANLSTEIESSLAFALVQLKHRIISSPPFWTASLPEDGISGNIGDLNIITMILDAAIRSENLYKEKIKEERELILNRGIKKAEDLMKIEDREEG